MFPWTSRGSGDRSGRLATGQPGPVPCTPAGIEALLAFSEIPVAGRDVVVLGRGTTLGRPLSLLLAGISLLGGDRDRSDRKADGGPVMYRAAADRFDATD